MEHLNQNFFTELEESMPPLIARADIERYLPGVLSSRHLANLISEGRGSQSAKIGRRVVYRRSDLIEWLAARTSALKPEEEENHEFI